MVVVTPILQEMNWLPIASYSCPIQSFKDDLSSLGPGFLKEHLSDTVRPMHFTLQLRPSVFRQCEGPLMGGHGMEGLFRGGPLTLDLPVPAGSPLSLLIFQQMAKTELFR